MMDIICALVFPAALILALGTIVAMLRSHGSKMLAALQMKPLGEIAAPSKKPAPLGIYARRKTVVSQRSSQAVNVRPALGSLRAA